MKKKSHHHVPDFSHRPAPRTTAADASAAGGGPKAAPPVAPRQTGKLRATSSKSGRRGQ